MNFFKSLKYKLMVFQFEKACKSLGMELRKQTDRVHYSYRNDKYLVSFEGDYRDIILHKSGFDEYRNEKCWIPVFAFENQAKFVKNARPMFSYNQDADEILTFLGLNEFKK